MIFPPSSNQSDPRRILIGAGLALDAAEDARIDTKVALVKGATGDYDLASYATSIATHTIQPVPPQPGIDRLPGQARRKCDGGVSHYLDQSRSEPDRGPPPARGDARSECAKAGPGSIDACRANDLDGIDDQRPQVVERLLNQLPPSAQDKLRRLSPSTHLDQLHAKVFESCARSGDSTVPYVQSRLLARSLRPGPGRYDDFPIFNHVDPTASVPPNVFVEDISRLAGHVSDCRYPPGRHSS